MTFRKCQTQPDFPDSDMAESARKVAKECFWGDYRLSADLIIENLQNGDEGFARFLFSRIFENSRRPSRHLVRLFPADRLLALLDRYELYCRDRRRFQVIKANITGNYSPSSEYAWKR